MPAPGWQGTPIVGIYRTKPQGSTSIRRGPLLDFENQLRKPDERAL